MKNDKLKSTVFYFMVFSVFFLICFPIFWAVLCSFKTLEEMLNVPLKIIPSTLTIEHYKKLILSTQIPKFFFNSFIVATGTSFLTVFIASLAAYSLTRFPFPGIGLAAPQVNVSKRLITIDLSVGENSQDLIILINPELTSQEGEVIYEEGCLSVPDINEKVVRPSRVTVKGIDLKGNEKIVEAEGLLARAISHEIDHINGKLFIDHLSPLKKNLIKKKLKRAVQTGKI